MYRRSIYSLRILFWLTRSIFTACLLVPTPFTFSTIHLTASMAMKEPLLKPVCVPRKSIPSLEREGGGDRIFLIQNLSRQIFAISSFKNTLLTNLGSYVSLSIAAKMASNGEVMFTDGGSSPVDPLCTGDVRAADILSWKSSELSSSASLSL